MKTNQEPSLISRCNKRFSELSDTRRFVLAIAIGTYTMAIADYFSPPVIRSGRGAWLSNWAIELFGTYGTVYLWLAVGTFMIARAIMGNKQDY